MHALVFFLEHIVLAPNNQSGILRIIMNKSIISSAVAGAVAGAVVTLTIFQTKLPGVLQQSSHELASQVSVTTAKSDYERAIVEAVHAAQPAVVSIVITKDVPVLEQYFQELPGQSNPLNDFFGFSPFTFRVPQLRQNGTQKQEVGGGSGFLVSSDGTIVTNRHVVSEADAQYTVFLNDGSKHEATVVARDPVADIAILKISGNNFPFLKFGDSSQLQVGQTAIAIGNALGEFRNTVSTGVVSGLSRSIQAGDAAGGGTEQLDEVIQTDAAINPGNSGGPLLDIAGKVIGVNVAIVQGSENIGFALPADSVKSIVESVEKTGKISRPYLGVRYVPITAALKAANKLSVDYGVLVVRGQNQDELAVVPGSPANKAGVVEGDIILEIDSQRLDEKTSLASLIRNKKVGDTITLKVLSKGQENKVQITLEEFPQQ